MDLFCKANNILPIGASVSDVEEATAAAAAEAEASLISSLCWVLCMVYMLLELSSNVLGRSFVLFLMVLGIADMHNVRMSPLTGIPIASPSSSGISNS